MQPAERRVRMLAGNPVPLLAYHFAWSGVGHVVKAGDGFRYPPAAQDLEGVTEL